MKNGKEIKITKNKNYNVVLGSVNNRNSKAIYINISAWSEPQQEENVQYLRVIKDINKKVKQTLFSVLSSSEETDFNKNNFIVDLDIRESGIRYGKRSFMSCEVTLFLKNEQSVNSEYMLDKLNYIVDSILKSSFEQNKCFKFYKKKV
jgi:hypothetical protein